MNAGFVGLGHLGRALVTRLKSQGVELTVWNRTLDKAKGLDVMVTDTPSSLLSKNKLIFLSLFDSSAVLDVMRMKGGLLEGDLNGRIIIDTTTNHYSRAEEFHRVFSDRGASYLEAPVLGSVVPALNGALTVLASGSRGAYDEALPYLQKIGSDIFYLDAPGLPTKLKLINNLVLASFMATLAEAACLGEAVGTDRKTALEVLSKGAGASAVLEAKKDKIIKEDYSVHFKTELLYKDLHCLQDLAKLLNRPVFTGSVIKELYAVAMKDSATLDFSAIYKAIKGI